MKKTKKINGISYFRSAWAVGLLALALSAAAAAEGTAQLFELAMDGRLAAQGDAVAAGDAVPIRIHPDALAADEGPATLAIPLPGRGTSLALRGSFTLGEDGSSIWTGRLIGEDAMTGDVILATVDGHVAGVVHAGDLTYRIVPLEGAEHELRLDSGELAGCSAEEPGLVHPEEETSIETETDAGRRSDPPMSSYERVLDGVDSGTAHVLGLSDPDAAPFENLPDPPDLLPQARLETQAQIGELRVLFLKSPYVVQDGARAEAVRKLQVAYANQTYANSGLNLRLVEAGVVTSPFTELGNSVTDIQRVTADSRVNQLRQQYQADIVAFYVRYMEGGVCGIGWIPPDNDVSRRNHGFNVVRWGCSTPEVVLVHEIGHNLGALHDIAQDRSRTIHGDDCHGYVDAVARRVTVMGYLGSCGSGCGYVPYFSDPDRFLGGRMLGSSNADNRRCVGLSAPTVSSYMPISGRPQAARNLKARKVKSTTAKLKWKNADKRADYFEVWMWDVDRQVLDLYTTVPVRKKKGKATLSGLRPGGRYTFIVRVVDRERGVSDRSNLAFFQTRLF